MDVFVVNVETSNVKVRDDDDNETVIKKQRKCTFASVYSTTMRDETRQV